MKGRMRVGPGAALVTLVVVVLSLSVLGMLTLMDARNDDRLSERAARVAEEIAVLEARSEESLAALDALLAQCAAQAQDEEDYLARVAAALPEDRMLAGRQILWREEDRGRSLECAAEIAPLGDFPRIQWREHRLNGETEEAWN